MEFGEERVSNRPPTKRNTGRPRAAATTEQVRALRAQGRSWRETARLGIGSATARRLYDGATSVPKPCQNSEGTKPDPQAVSVIQSLSTGGDTRGGQPSGEARRLRPTFCEWLGTDRTALPGWPGAHHRVPGSRSFSGQCASRRTACKGDVCRYDLCRSIPDQRSSTKRCFSRGSTNRTSDQWTGIPG